MRRNGRRTWLMRGLGALALVMTFGYIPYHLYARSGFAKYIELRAELAGLRAQNDQLRAENGRLVREAEALRSDPDAIERVARQELGWVRPGELIVDLGRPEPTRP